VLLVGYKSIPREALFSASVRTGYRVFFTQTPVVAYPIIREQLATIFTNTVSLRTSTLQMMVKITAVDSLTTPLRTDQFAKPAPPFLGVQVIFQFPQLADPLTTFSLVVAPHLQ